MHLVHEYVRHTLQPRVALQPSQKHPGGAEQKARVVARLAFAPDRVTHRPSAGRALAALARDALRHPDGADPPRLRAHDVHGRARLRRVLEEVLRHLRGLAAAGLALHDRHWVALERADERVP
eukprot:1130746-Rhodomonas_salina.1